MKALFIGGTGTISTEVTRLAANMGWEMVLLNRGNRLASLADTKNISYIKADINDEADVKQKLSGMKFDVVANFINFLPQQVERDVRLFFGSTGQYFFISSASAYQKPPSNYLITESTPLANPFWKYSRDKIDCENLLMREYRDNGFPVTIIRPSHTYNDNYIPVGLHGKKGSWQVLSRMQEGKPVIVHGDGSSLWTVTHSSDFAKAFVGLMSNVHAIGEAFHITSDESLTWNQIYTTIAGVLGVKPNLAHISTDFLTAFDPDLVGGLIGDKSNSVVFDNTKIKRLVPGFTATIRFDQGVRTAITSFLANPELRVPDPEFDAWSDKVIAAHQIQK